MKKFISLLLGAVMCFGFVACNASTNTEGSSGDETSDVSSEETETSATAEPTEPDVTTSAEVPEKPEEKLIDVTYEIGTIASATGKDSSNKKRFRSVGYLTLADVEAIAIGKGYHLIWFAYDKDYNYLGNGTNTYPTLPEKGIWLDEGKDATKDDIMKWNASSVYLRFAVKEINESALSDADIASSQVKVYASGYHGDTDSVTLGLDKVANIASGQQDGDVYGSYLFSFNSSGVCKVYYADTYQYVSDFTLDKIDVLKPHSNSVCFGSYKYDSADEFPLLYCNVYNNYKNDRSYDGTCNVYRIQRNGNAFTSTLLQVIKVGFTDDTSKWSSEGGDVRPFGNFAVDTDSNRLYAFTMRDSGKTTRFFSFALPTISDGTLDTTLGVKKVTLGVDDIIDTFDTEYFNYVQGAIYHGGKIYSLEGFTNNETNKPALRVVDLAEKKVCNVIDLYGMNLKVEPEAVYVFNGVGYYFDISGNVYSFPIS